MPGKKRTKILQNKLDPAVWIPRKEAARILYISLPTVLRLAGPSFRIAWTRDPSGRKLCFVNAADVERVRLERLGPKMDELERLVLSQLASGKTPNEIVCAHRHVTLEDIQRIRDLSVHMCGGFIVNPPEATEVRKYLDESVVDGISLAQHVRAIVERMDKLARARDAEVPGVFVVHRRGAEELRRLLGENVVDEKSLLERVRALVERAGTPVAPVPTVSTDPPTERPSGVVPAADASKAEEEPPSSKHSS